MERARRFYEDKVGPARIEAETEGTIRHGCGGGTGLALVERPTEPLDWTVAAWEVEASRRRSRSSEAEGSALTG